MQITAHMETLLKVRPVKSMDNLEQLRKLYNVTEICIRNLNLLKMDIASYGYLFIPILNERIPEELKILISRNFGNNVWSLEKMLQFFNEELLFKERCQSLHGQKASYLNLSKEQCSK